jgi:tetratricopeptide (TPR) repeat protein
LAGRQKALALARTLGEPWLEAATLNDLGTGCLRRERYTEAIEYLRQALPLSPGAQRGRLEGVIEGNLGDAHLGLGNYEQALSHLERGLTLRQQAGDWVGQPGVLGRAARARQGMRNHSEAIALCEHALSIGRDHGYPLDNAAILDTLGTSLQHTSDIERATTCWHEALDTFDRFADPRAAELRARLQVLETTNSRSGSVPTTLPHSAEVANPTALPHGDRGIPTCGLALPGCYG